MPFRARLLRARFARLLLRNEPSPSYPYRNCFILILAMPFVRVYVFELFLGRCLSGPGYSGLAKARLLLRNEPSPAYPYRGNFMLNYVFCEVFGSDFCYLNYLGDAYWLEFFNWIIWARPCGPGFCGFRFALEHPADGSPSGPTNPSRIFHKIVTFRNWHRWF